MPSHRVLKQLAISDNNDVATLDLSDLDWVTPAVMVGSAALARRYVDAGQPFALIAPTSDNVLGYLARMRLGHVLSDLRVDHDVPTRARARDRHNDLLELAPVATDAQALTLARLVERNVAREDAECALSLFKSLGEVGGNVADHARAVGYMAAQKMPASNELHIAVADGGVGLLHWLALTRDADSHTQALTMALDGLSRHTDAAEAGGGIVRTLSLVAQMSGTALLASGDAWCVDRAGQRSRGRTRTPFDGTLFEARIPLGSHQLP